MIASFYKWLYDRVVVVGGSQRAVEGKHLLVKFSSLVVIARIVAHAQSLCITVFLQYIEFKHFSWIALETFSFSWKFQIKIIRNVAGAERCKESVLQHLCNEICSSGNGRPPALIVGFLKSGESMRNRRHKASMARSKIDAQSGLTSSQRAGSTRTYSRLEWQSDRIMRSGVRLIFLSDRCLSSNAQRTDARHASGQWCHRIWSYRWNWTLS
jgi:hypothetical protein